MVFCAYARLEEIMYVRLEQLFNIVAYMIYYTYLLEIHEFVVFVYI